MLRELREPANALIHLAGAFLSAAALVGLIWIGIGTGDSGALIGLSVYGLSQLALYSASTLFHAVRGSAERMEFLLRLDCMLVFVFIAGTYTPVCLIALGQGWRWTLLGTVWGITLVGLAMKLWWLHAPVWLSTALYIGMGWVALAAIPALIRALPGQGIAWFVAGGSIYTIGAVIFMLDRPWPLRGVFEAHAIWHLCVIGGSCCCYWAIVAYVVPLA